MTGALKIDLKRADLKVKALEHRLAGLTYHEISMEMGLGIGQVRNLIRDAMEELNFEQGERAQELRELVLMRNEAMIRGILPQALGGDLFSVDRMLKIQQQSLDLVGAFPPKPVAGKHADDEQLDRPMVILPSLLNEAEVPASELPETIEGSVSKKDQEGSSVLGTE